MPRVSTFCPRCGEAIETEVPEEARTAGRAALECPSCKFAFEIAPPRRPTAAESGASAGWSRAGAAERVDDRPSAATPSSPPQVSGWAPSGPARDATPRTFKPVVAAMLLFFAAVVGLWMGSTVVFQDDPLRTALDDMEGQGNLTGLVTDSEGDPVANVTVTLVSPDNASATREARTDTAGRYGLGEVEPGVYVLEFTAEGYRSVRLETFAAGDDLSGLFDLGGFGSVQMEQGTAQPVDEQSNVDRMERIIRGFGIWFIVASLLAGAGAVATTLRRYYPLAVIGAIGGILSYGIFVGTIASAAALVLVVLARKEFARKPKPNAT